MDKSPGWAQLDLELLRWQQARREVTLWWRDDDAVDASRPLERLLELTAAYAVPLALAVIPKALEPGLGELLSSTRTAVLQHGATHENCASPPARSSEFPPERDAEGALRAIERGRLILERSFGPRLEPVFVPPWNRLSASLVERIVPEPFAAVSCFGSGPGRAGDRRFVNTHVDVIDWRGSRGFVGAQRALGALVGHLAERRAAPGESGVTGLLTHHLVHDAETWTFLEMLCERLAGAAGVRWMAVGQLLADPVDAGH